MSISARQWLAGPFRLSALAIGLAAATTGLAQNRTISFARDIQPLLKKRCLECHGGTTRKGNISFASRVLATSKGESGATAVVPLDLVKSELITRIITDDPDDQMPPKERLSESEIDLLKTWIRQGAKWPEHWSLKPVVKPKPPVVKQTDWPRNAIDHFVLAKLESEMLRPSSEADRRTLIRRLSLDLIGFLPKPEAVEAFVKDGSSKAYDKVVNRLLASKHFGERWARHWLDEARYADSSGYEKDSTRADAYRWRDWVIRAINDDLPFDQFTIKQLAGDLLPDASRQDRLATAFQLMTQFNLEGGVDAEEDRTKRVMDSVNTLGSVWLGTSVGCTQCHNHPYDPFTQKEFYQLYSFFDNTDFDAIFIDEFPNDAEKRIIERHAEWTKLKDLLDRQVTDKNLATQLQGALSRLRRSDNTRGFTRVVTERKEKRRKTYLFSKGEFLRPDKSMGEIQPGTSAAWPVMKARQRFAPQTAEQKKKKEKRRQLPADRMDLAKWLIDPAHPATARVAVNKIWLHFFGRAICTQPQDLGVAGELPSHPQLLDWLAHHYIHDAKWSRKQLIREIVTSATYRQSSDQRAELLARDPDNRLLARQSRFRVEAEIVRDLYLQASGLLSPKVGGPSVFPPIPADVAALSYANNFRWKVSTGEDRYRRGMYTFYKRTAPDPNLTLFDCPDAAISNQKRSTSNTPLQALATLQNEVFVDAIRALAAKLITQKHPNDEARLQQAFAITVGRPATKTEIATVKQLLTESRSWYKSNSKSADELIGDRRCDSVSPAEYAAWIATARIILNTDEFITRS